MMDYSMSSSLSQVNFPFSRSNVDRYSSPVRAGKSNGPMGGQKLPSSTNRTRCEASDLFLSRPSYHQCRAEGSLNISMDCSSRRLNQIN